MSLLLKDPGALLDYSIDWGAEYLSGDAIADSLWTVSPDEPGGVAVEASAFDANLATVSAGGGVPGQIYRLTNRVVLTSGRTDARSVMLRVEKR